MCTGGGEREGDGEGERKDTEGWTESRIRGKVKRARNRELKTESTGNDTVTRKVRKGGVRVKEKDRAECWGRTDCLWRKRLRSTALTPNTLVVVLVGVQRSKK